MAHRFTFHFSGSVKSGGYIPERFASRYNLYPPLFTSPSGYSCIILEGQAPHIGTHYTKRKAMNLSLCELMLFFQTFTFL